MGQWCYIAVVVLSQQAGPPPQTIEDIQRAGIKTAVEALEKQVSELASQSGQEAILVRDWDDNPSQKPKVNQKDNQQEWVAALADLMADNVLLTRTYLALAIAEHKRITLESCATCLSPEQKWKYLRHVEAIQLAIDDRILESQDVRVLRVLQAGVNQSLREELADLRETPSNVQYFVVKGRRATLGFVPRRRFCR